MSLVVSAAQIGQVAIQRFEIINGLSHATRLLHLFQRGTLLAVLVILMKVLPIIVVVSIGRILRVTVVATFVFALRCDHIQIAIILSDMAGQRLRQEGPSAFLDSKVGTQEGRCVTALAG